MRKHLSVVLIVSLLAGFVPAMVWNTSPVQAVFDVPYSPSSTAQSYQIGQELVDMRDQFTTVYYEGQGQYSADYSMVSIHYEDEYGDWQDIDTTIQDATTRPNWDWEVVKGHWTLLIKDDTSVAIGKDGNWLGFKYVGFGYLDWATKDYVVLGTVSPVTPTVVDNTITWEGLFAGVNLEYVYTPDGFKENLYVTQTARDWLATHPPSSYGLNNPTSYLVGAIECDWQSAYPAEDVFGVPINWDNVNEFIDGGVYWRNPISQKIAAALPLGYALHDDVAAENATKLQYRFYEDSGTHYLLFGAKVLDLNAYPAGTINLDPSVDVQVGQSSDDAQENYNGGGMTLTGTMICQSATSPFMYHVGARWTSGSFPTTGSTITAAYTEFYIQSTANDDLDSHVYFQDSAAPVTFGTSSYNISSRSRTTANIDWAGTSLGAGWETSPSLVTVVQEVVDSYSPTAMACIVLGDVHTPTETCTFETWDSWGDHSRGPKLHLEWTEPSLGIPPTVVTLSANSIGATSANMRGNVTSVNDTNIKYRGFGWDTVSRGLPDEDTDPAASNYTNSWTESGNWTTGTFNYSGASLTAATTYYYRAAANNTDSKWGWGDELSFLTKPAAPTNVAATDGTYTDKVIVTWNLSAGNISGYYVMYGGAIWLATVSNTTTSYNDTTAAAPTITPGTASATDGSSTSQVTLSLAGEGGTNGAPRTYYLIAYNVAGNSTDSATDTGYRAASALSYQWCRSSGDADSGYSTLAGATTDPYNDTTAPAPTITPGTASATDALFTDKVVLQLSGETGNNGAGRYYKCEVSMSGASSQNSTSDRGYRGTDTLTYQWYRSSGDADSGYSTLAGATTDPYDDTTAPQGTITPGAAVASDGSSPLHTTLSVTGESTSPGDGRYYKCEVSMNGATSQNSTSDRGTRGVGGINYQWMRSSGDADSGYGNIGGATTDPYDDTAAPAPTVTGGNATASDGTSTSYVTLNLTNHQGNNGDGRYYLATLSASGAASQNTTSNRGYRGTTTLTFQWMRSAADSDAAYSNIGGATTVPYNDTGGVEDPDGRYYKATVSMSGASSQNSTPDRGYEQAANEPTVVTLNASNLACTTATLSGNITDVTGGNATTRGFQYGTSTGNYSWGTNETGNFGLGTYSLNVTSLTQNSTWYYRAFAVNGEGTGYGSELSFNTTATGLPIVTNSAATGITDAEATLHGTITDTGCAGQTVSTRGFQWGTSTGNYSWNWTQSGSYSTGAFSHEISSLSANTTYYWRSLATNPAGSNYSAELYFTTEAEEEAAPTTVAADMSELIDYLEELFGGPMGIVATMFAIALLGFAIWKKGWIRIVLALGVVIWGAFATSYDIKIGAPLIAIGVVLFFLGLFQVIKQHRQAAEEAATE